MAFTKLVGQAVHAYLQNIKLVLAFSVPFAVALPLSLLLPNYVALSGIFLRPGSLGPDVTLADTALMIIALLVSMLLFAFALAAITNVVKAQRTMSRLKFTDFERMEEATLKMFSLLLVSFLALFAVNLLLFQAGIGEVPRMALAALVSAGVSLILLFAPQAIVIDHASVENAVTLSISATTRKPKPVLAFIALSIILLVINTAATVPLGAFGPFAALAVNALFIVPFLEVLKVQIYLSKYTLL